MVRMWVMAMGLGDVLLEWVQALDPSSRDPDHWTPYCEVWY